MPLQPAGAAVTVSLTEPVPPLFVNPRLALQSLFALLCSPHENAGVNAMFDGDTLTVTVVFVSPVERLSDDGDWLTVKGYTWAEIDPCGDWPDWAGTNGCPL